MAKRARGRPPATWKFMEREVAEFLGTRRVPLSGKNSGHGTSSDSLHRSLYVECKYGQGAPGTWNAIEILFEDIVRKATLEGKMPVLVCKSAGTKGGAGEWDAYIQVDAPTMGGVRPVCVPLRVVRQIAKEMPR